MIEQRLSLNPAYTQRFTTELLFILGLISVPSAPIIGHFADKTSSRKIPLLIALFGCLAGTLLVATTLSIWAVYAGRILQGISGTGAWIVGFAMLTDAAGAKHMGKTLGLAGSFITAGVIMGPAVSGVLLQWLGYWAAWAVPLGLLGVDFLARLAMVEEERTSAASEGRGSSSGTGAVDGDREEEEEDESAPLLVGDVVPDEEVKKRQRRGFYRIVLSNGTAWAAMLNVVAFAMILSGFDATLPLHLRDAFGWGPAPIG